MGNIQNIPTDPEIRACWEAREGYLFCSTDYESAELRSLAQVCLNVVGYSILADELKAGLDPHLSFASKRLGLEYTEALRRKEAGDKSIKEARQRAKAANFGIPGGLGAETFIAYSRGYGVKLDLEEAREIISDWKAHYAESKPYFRYTSDQTGRGTATLVHPITGFTRGDTSFTSGSNFWFQSLTASYTKAATYEVVKESWIGASTDGEFDGVKKVSPLFGARPNLMIHDQIISEMRPKRAHEAGYRQALLMRREADRLVPDIPNPVEPALSKNWEKDVATVLDNTGRLVEWIP